MPTQTRKRKQIVEQANKPKQNKGKSRDEAILFGEAPAVKPGSKRIKKARKTKAAPINPGRAPNSSKRSNKTKKAPKVAASKAGGGPGAKSAKQQILKQIGAGQLMKTMKNRAHLEKKTNDNPPKGAPQLEKGKEPGQAKFTPGDKIELSSPQNKSIEIAKSVREPNYMKLHVADEEDFNSDSPSQKRQRAQAIQKLKSKTARIVARDSLRRIQIVQEKPRELTKRTDNAKKDGQLYKNSQQMVGQKSLKATGRSALLDLRQFKNRSVIQPNAQTLQVHNSQTQKHAASKTPPQKQKLQACQTPELKSAQPQAIKPKLVGPATPQRLPKQRSLEEEAKRAKLPLDEYLLFRQDASSQLSGKSVSQKSNRRPRSQRVSKVSHRSRAEAASKDSLVDLIQKKPGQNSRMEFVNSNQIILEPQQQEVEMKDEEIEDQEQVKHATPQASKSKRGAKQAQKHKAANPSKDVPMESKALVAPRELKTLQKVLAKVESSIEGEDELQRFGKRAKTFVKYIESLTKKQ